MSFPPMQSDFYKAVAEKENANVFDQQMQAQSVAVGNLALDQVSGIIALAMAQIRRNHATDQEKKERSMRDILQQALQQYIENLTHDIANIEAGFKAEFGDAWREEIALRIFNEDNIPQQRSGESIGEYRKRLEQALIEEMLNDDGTIKQRYSDDPALAKYAEWAQKNYNLDAAQEKANDLASRPIEHPQTKMMLNDLDEKANAELNTYTARLLHDNEEQKQAVTSVDDAQYDKNGSADYSGFANSFGKPIG